MTAAETTARNCILAHLPDNGDKTAQNLAAVDVARVHRLPLAHAQTIVRKVWAEKFEIMGPN